MSDSLFVAFWLLVGFLLRVLADLLCWGARRLLDKAVRSIWPFE